MALTGAWISWTLAATALAWPPAPALAALPAAPGPEAAAAGFKPAFAALRGELEPLVATLAAGREQPGARLAAALQQETALLEQALRDLPDNWDPAAGPAPATPAQAAAILRIANAAKSWVPNPNLDGSTAFFEGAASLEGTPDQGGIILAADNPALPPAQAFCDRVHALLAEVEFLARSPALERARQAARKNDLFVKNTVDQQFPWEAAVNSRCVPATLEGPPTWQLVFGHLQGGVAVPLRGRTTVTPSVVLEGIGYERLNPRTYARAWGASAIFIPATSSADHNGVGLLVRLGKGAQAVGAVVKRTDDGGHVGSLVYSVNFGSILKSR